MDRDPFAASQALAAALEQKIRRQPGVIDAAVLCKRATTPMGERDVTLVAFVVPTAGGNIAPLLDELTPAPTRTVSLRSLPRTADGEVDRVLLGQLPVIDDDLRTKLEQSIASEPGVARVATLLEDTRVLPERVHLMDLPGGGTSRATRPDSSPTVDQVTSEVPRVLAAAQVDSPPLPAVAGQAMTLGAALLAAAERCQEPRITYVGTTGDVSVTLGETRDEANRILGGLRASGLQVGDYVVLQLNEPRAIVTTFWACVFGGFIPVICSVPPGYEVDTADRTKLLHIWGDLGFPRLVVDALNLAGLADYVAAQGQAATKALVWESLATSSADGQYHSAEPDDIAFLSTTSGSTGAPKCIALTHRNLLSRGRGTNALCQHDTSDVILNWLPFDHIGSISDWHVRCVDLGCRMVYCSKELVLGSPLEWLRLINDYRITHSWAPNFAYALINAALDASGGGEWDLSCMKSLLTAGEAVSSNTVTQFLDKLARYGLASTAVRPAFGMAELGSGVTYFLPTPERPFSNLVIDRRSLGGSLVEAGPGASGIAFAALGTVIPAMSMRIVSESGEVCPERTIGSLHVKGEAVTPGYLHNPEANAQVFVGGGWFDTGDRGFIWDGQLYLTGRNKDTIIVNGANYYPGEIESAAEQVPGVMVSFVAACGVRSPYDGMEGVAVFLAHEPMPERRLGRLLRAVSAKIVERVGIKPDFLVPIAPADIPKTTIGKIQRSALTRRFDAGEFEAIVRQVECLLEKDTTLPNWFFLPGWVKKTLGTDTRALPGELVIVSSPASDKLARALQVRARTEGVPCRLATALGESEVSESDREPAANSVWLDLTGLGQPVGDSFFDSTALQGSLASGCLRAHGALKAQAQRGALPSALWQVASAAQPVRDTDPIDAGRALCIPLLKALELGTERFSFRHVDVPPDAIDEPGLADQLWDEFTVVHHDQEVAYRDGARWTSTLEVPDWQSTYSHPLFDNTSGFVVVAGGLGGIGQHICRALHKLGHRLLLLGRRPAPPNEALLALGNAKAPGDPVSVRAESIAYQQCDLADVDSVAAAVEAGSAHFGQAPSTFVHVAGLARECPILEETPDGFASVFGAKVYGGNALAQVMQRYPLACALLFSSASTTIGTSQTGAYAMSNAYLDVLVHRLRQAGRVAHAVNWAPWDDVGLNAGGNNDAVFRAMGLRSVGVRDGLESLFVVLRTTAPRTIVGLNAENARVAVQLRRAGTSPVRELTAYYSREGDAPPLAPRRPCTDRFGTAFELSLVELPSLPLTADGQVDKEALAAQSSDGRAPHVAPRNPVEAQLAAIFSRVLSQQSVSVTDSFFDLGGTSLLSIRLFNEIEQQLGVRLPPATLVKSSTIEELALLFQSPEDATYDSLIPMTPGRKGPGIFLVHDADGETILYRNLANALGDTPVFALQPFGDGRSRALHTTIDEMSNYYLAKVRETQPEGPYMIGGMCAGGVIAFEMACRLQAQGEQVAMVALLDAVDPHAPRRAFESQERARRFRAALLRPDAIQVAGTKVKRYLTYVSKQRIGKLAARTKVTLLRELRRRGVQVPDLLTSLDPRTIYEFAQAKYHPGVFAGELLLFRATKADEEQGKNGITDTPAIDTTSDPLLGWGPRATRGVTVIDVPGGHSSMLQPPHVQVLSKQLRARIEQALRAYEGALGRSERSA